MQYKKIPFCNILTILVKILIVMQVFCMYSSALAQSAGDTVLSVGWLHLAPQDSSTPLTFVAPPLGPVPGSGSTVRDADTLGVSMSYFYNDNLALVADFGLPPRMHLYGSGSLAGIGLLGTADKVAPAVLLKYFTGEAKQRWRPYIGGGLAYISFADIAATSQFQQALGMQFGDPSASTSVALSSSWAPILNLGLSYEIQDNWFANFSLSYVHSSTDATLTTHSKTVGNVISKNTMDVNPVVAFISIGRRF